MQGELQSRDGVMLDERGGDGIRGFSCYSHLRLRCDLFSCTNALFPILKERRRQLAGTMSGGEQQMLAIGRGMMARPKILLLDEPSWGIAPKLVTKILDTIIAINAAGVSILLVEQNVRRALAIANRAYVIQTGRMVLEGSGQELLDSELVRQAYLGV